MGLTEGTDLSLSPAATALKVLVGAGRRLQALRLRVEILTFANKKLSTGANRRNENAAFPFCVRNLIFIIVQHRALHGLSLWTGPPAFQVHGSAKGSTKNLASQCPLRYIGVVAHASTVKSGPGSRASVGTSRFRNYIPKIGPGLLCKKGPLLGQSNTIENIVYGAQLLDCF